MIAAGVTLPRLRRAAELDDVTPAEILVLAWPPGSTERWFFGAGLNPADVGWPPHKVGE
jgi:hypothetical protein